MPGRYRSFSGYKWLYPDPDLCCEPMQYPQVYPYPCNYLNPTPRLRAPLTHFVIGAQMPNRTRCPTCGLPTGAQTTPHGALASTTNPIHIHPHPTHQNHWFAFREHIAKLNFASCLGLSIPSSLML